MIGPDMATWTDSLVDLGVPGILGGLLGVLLGWLLTERSAGRARREEWERADQQAVNLRVRDWAEQLDDVLAGWYGKWSSSFRKSHEYTPTRPSELLDEHGRWERVWRRFEYRIPDHALADRLDAVHQFLSVVEREAADEDAPSIDLTLQTELVIVTGRWALAAFLSGRSDYPPPFCPTGPEWFWVFNHGPSDDPWTCIAAWIALHRHDDGMLHLAANVREVLVKDGRVPAFDAGWDFDGRGRKPDPSPA
jgi:hypothetical protein